jgi:hypothetical protein
MKIVMRDINELIPYINNPRKNDDAVDMVASSIKNFGFKVPIVIDKNNEIVSGHTRLKAAKKLGLEEVPCVVADDLSDQQIRAFRIADNKVSEFSMWDNDLLKIELDGLQDVFTGFDEQDFELINFENIAYKEKEPVEKKTQLTVTFEQPTDLKKVEEELRELFNKYEKLRIVVSSGEV